MRRRQPLATNNRAGSRYFRAADCAGAHIRAKPSRDDFNLNAIAKAVNKALKEISEESFVETTKTVEHTRREAAMETVKYVIDTKLAEEKAAATRAERKQEKEKLLSILAEKQAGKLSELSEKELQKRIASLED